MPGTRSLTMVLLGLMAFGLTGTFVWAGVQSNLIGELVAVARLPWGLVTLVDLFVGLFAVALWIAVLERSWWPTLGWIVLLLCLGNLVTLVYVFIRIRRCETLLEALTPTHKPEI